MGGRDPREAELPFPCLALSGSPFQWKIGEIRNTIFLCPPLFPWSPCLAAAVGPRPGWEESDLQGASPLPGQEAFPKARSRTERWRAAFHPLQLLCVGLGSGHREWTRKYQWALSG